MLGALSLLAPFPSRLVAQPDLWNSAKDYTAYVAGGGAAAAKAAGEAAKLAVANAKEALADAKALLTAAQGANGGAGLSAGTIAALAARVATAEAAVASAEAAAGIVAAVGVGAVGGTLIGQGADWVISKVWGLFADNAPPPRPVGPVIPQPFYVQPTAAQLTALAPTLLNDALGTSLTSADFTAAGPAGLLTQSFLTQGENIFLTALSGGAAATIGRNAEALQAANDLALALRDYRTTSAQMADLLESTQLESPVPALSQQRDLYASDVAAAKAECAASGADCTDLDALLDQSLGAFSNAVTAAASASYPALIGGPNAVLPELTLTAFQQFLADAGTFGAAALPPAEIVIANELVGASGVSFLGFSDVGSLIAAWDAANAAGNREAVIFDPLTGRATLADILRGASTTLSCDDPAHCDGPWLRIDPLASPLVATPEPSSATLVATGLAGAALLAWRRRRRGARDALSVTTSSACGPTGARAAARGDR